MNNTEIITFFVFVALILMFHYNMTQCYRGKSSEYFGGHGGHRAGAVTAISDRHSSLPPIQFNVTNELMQRFLTKLSDFVFKYSNKMYS